MKVNHFLDLAAASRSLLFAWATRALVVLGLLLLPFMVGPGVDFTSGSFAYAEKPPGVGGGKPDPSPGSGGQGKPDEPPGGGGGKPDKPGRGDGDIYSDLVVKYRTEDGLPIYVEVPAGQGDEVVEVAAEEPGGDFVACEQPIALGEIDEDEFLDHYADNAFDLFVEYTLGNPIFNWADGTDVSPIPLGGAGYAGEECDVAVSSPINGDIPDYSGLLREVHFGRINSGRAPAKVVEQQLAEVYAMLRGANVTLGLDHVGRITVNGTEIDSPLQSLAIFRELLIHGELSGVTLPDISSWSTADDPEFDFAAAALGGAAEKGDYWVSGPVSLDLVVYFNRILDIPNQTFLTKLLGDGIEGAFDEYYLDFSGYSYDRGDKYPGCVIYFHIADGQRHKDTIMNRVFGVVDNDFSGSNVYGFAVAADDSRRVISFRHDTDNGIYVQQIDSAGDDEVCSIVLPE